ncbi:unnamed protein product [Nezara viridula]|uniref:Uncharacterized protein n=1 Tax=Nezara viridula TaxID=85310 RepID=A0A9P0EDA8_NEZVI|nr:unnamed protein product [Nezara viridula]
MDTDSEEEHRCGLEALLAAGQHHKHKPPPKHHTIDAILGLSREPQGDMSLEEGHHSGQPTDVDSSDIKALIEQDCRYEKLRRLKICFGTVQRHLTGYVSRHSVWGVTQTD